MFVFLFCVETMALSFRDHGAKLLAVLLDFTFKPESTEAERELVAHCISVLQEVQERTKDGVDYDEEFSSGHLFLGKKNGNSGAKEDALDITFGAHVLVKTDGEEDVIVSYETAKHLLRKHDESRPFYRVACIRRETWHMIRGIASGFESNEFVQKWRSDQPCELPTPWITWGIVQDGVCAIDYLSNEELEKRTHHQILVEFPDGLYRKIMPSNNIIGLMERILKEPVRGECQPIPFGMYIMIIGQAPPVSVEDLLARRIPPRVNWFALRSPFFRLIRPSVVEELMSRMRVLSVTETTEKTE